MEKIELPLIFMTALCEEKRRIYTSRAINLAPFSDIEFHVKERRELRNQTQHLSIETAWKDPVSSPCVQKVMLRFRYPHSVLVNNELTPSPVFSLIYGVCIPLYEVQFSLL